MPRASMMVVMMTSLRRPCDRRLPVALFVGLIGGAEHTLPESLLSIMHGGAVGQGHRPVALLQSLKCLGAHMAGDDSRSSGIGHVHGGLNACSLRGVQIL